MADQYLLNLIASFWSIQLSFLPTRFSLNQLKVSLARSNFIYHKVTIKESIVVCRYQKSLSSKNILELGSTTQSVTISPVFLNLKADWAHERCDICLSGSFKYKNFHNSDRRFQHFLKEVTDFRHEERNRRRQER